MTSDEEILEKYITKLAKNYEEPILLEKYVLVLMKLARSAEREQCEKEMHGLSTARRLAEQIEQKEKEIQKLKEELKEYEFCRDWPAMIQERNAEIKKLRDALNGTELLFMNVNCGGHAEYGRCWVCVAQNEIKKKKALEGK